MALSICEQAHLCGLKFNDINPQMIEKKIEIYVRGYCWFQQKQKDGSASVGLYRDLEKASQIFPAPYFPFQSRETIMTIVKSYKLKCSKGATRTTTSHAMVYIVPVQDKQKTFRALTLRHGHPYGIYIQGL